jgi:transposase
MELGIRRNQLYKWKEQKESKGDKAFSGRGRPKKEDQSEMATLRQENERLKEENEILKKAAVYSISQRNTRYSNRLKRRSCHGSIGTPRLD